MFSTIERFNTFRTLDTYRKNAFRISDYQMEHDRYIIFSDTHAGDRRPTLDEFQHNETELCHALDHYLNQDYGLILNGDVEEGWKNRYQDIMAAYESSVYAKESEFAGKGERAHLRIWGNHDDVWKDRKMVNRYLGGVLRQPVRVHPAVILGDSIMVTHGHQGDPNADYMARFSRLIVRHLWRRIQPAFNLERQVSSQLNPAWKKREHYLHEWAQSRKIMLIAGHTHRPVFQEFSPRFYFAQLRENIVRHLSSIPDPYLQNLFEAALQQLDKWFEAAHISPEFTPDDNQAFSQMTPCYLNAGSCLSHEGITGIEIDCGEIRLVKWKNIQRTVEQQGNLGQMLASL